MKGLICLIRVCQALNQSDFSYFGTSINRPFCVLDLTLNLGFKVSTSCGNYY